MGINFVCRIIFASSDSIRRIKTKYNSFESGNTLVQKLWLIYESIWQISFCIPTARSGQKIYSPAITFIASTKTNVLMAYFQCIRLIWYQKYQILTTHKFSANGFWYLKPSYFGFISHRPFRLWGKSLKRSDAAKRSLVCKSTQVYSLTFF